MNPEITLAITNAQASQVTNAAAIETYLTAFVERLIPSNDRRDRAVVKVMTRLLLFENDFCDLVAEKVGLRKMLEGLPTIDPANPS